MSAAVADLAIIRSGCLPQTGLVGSGCGQGWQSTSSRLASRRCALSVLRSNVSTVKTLGLPSTVFAGSCWRCVVALLDRPICGVRPGDNFPDIPNRASGQPVSGRPRRGTIALIWRLEPADPVPFELEVRIEIPGHYGQSSAGSLVLTLKLVSRLTAWLNADRSATPPPLRRRLEVSEWAALLDSAAATLTCDEVVAPVADLADVDPITVGQPRVLHVVSGPPIPDLLPAQLRPIRGAGVSHGAHMQADPVLDQSDPAERAEQVDLWLNQMGADAGLLGMERLVTEMRKE